MLTIIINSLVITLFIYSIALTIMIMKLRIDFDTYSDKSKNLKKDFIECKDLKCSNIIIQTLNKKHDNIIYPSISLRADSDCTLIKMESKNKQESIKLITFPGQTGITLSKVGVETERTIL